MQYFRWYLLPFLFLLNVSTSCHSDAEETGDVCANLEQQIVNGKWASYDIVLDNCLVRKFIEAGGEEVDFYVLLKDLEKLTEREVGILQDDLTRISSSADKSKIKLELEVKAAKRKLNRRRLELNTSLDEDRVQATLMETEIRDLMDRCQLGRDKGSSLRNLENCSNDADKTLARLREFCRHLRGKCALLMAETLNKSPGSNS